MFLVLFVPLLSSCGGTGVVVVVGNDADPAGPGDQRDDGGLGGLPQRGRRRRQRRVARDMTSTPRPETLTAGGHGDQDQPAVSDHYIVWVDDAGIRAHPAPATP
jgi:hypothetical protein